MRIETSFVVIIYYYKFVEARFCMSLIEVWLPSKRLPSYMLDKGPVIVVFK
jgi:hypothetical protein